MWEYMAVEVKMYAFMGIEWCKWSCAQYFIFISIVTKLKFTVNEQLQRNGLNFEFTQEM